MLGGQLYCRSAVGEAESCVHTDSDGVRAKIQTVPRGGDAVEAVLKEDLQVERHGIMCALSDGLQMLTTE